MEAQGMTMDITQALKNAENSLRDFISLILAEKLGDDWEKNSGVSTDRIERWEERRLIERGRQRSGAVDDRLIYYADIYDLKTIFKKHWNYFSDAFGELKVFLVYLNEIEKLRDPDAHRREALPHQKNLILGISGDIRSKIARYRSSLETAESYYPRVEFAADNLGNSWKPGQSDWLRTKISLRPGDLIEHIVTATDPLGEKLLYQCTYNQGQPCTSPGWTEDNSFSYTVKSSDIGRMFFVAMRIKSNRKFHASGSYDSDIMFTYEVLPPKKAMTK